MSCPGIIQYPPNTQEQGDITQKLVIQVKTSFIPKNGIITGQLVLGDIINNLASN